MYPALDLVHTAIGICDVKTLVLLPHDHQVLHGHHGHRQREYFPLLFHFVCVAHIHCTLQRPARLVAP